MLLHDVPWVGGAALLGVLAACWGRLRALLGRLASLLVVRVRVEEDAGQAVAAYCWVNFRRSPFGERRYSAFTEFVKPLGRYQSIGFEQPGTDALVFWDGWRPFVLAYGHDSHGMAANGATVLPSSLYVTFLRGTFDPDALVADALDRLNEHRHRGGKSRSKRFSVRRVSGRGPVRTVVANRGNQPEEHKPPDATNSTPDRRLLRWRPEDVGAADGGRDPWGALAFTPEAREVAGEARRWLDSEPWYKARRIAWRWGLLLHGAPGTGKTSYARALAQDLDLPVTSFDLGSFGNDDFVEEWRRLLNRVPCVALIEDVDAVFLGRQNRLGEAGGGLSFDCLLNCLSGIEATDGVLVVVTTNRVEDLDDALGRPAGNGTSTRPGRIDRVLELGPPGEDARRAIARRVLADCPHEAEGLVALGAGDSGAQFQDRCTRVALEHYWRKEPHARPLHDGLADQVAVEA